MKRKIFLLSIIVGLVVGGRFSFANIYMYIDEYGQKHLTNQPVAGAALIKELSTLPSRGEVEDVQTLLSSPRFNHSISMETSHTAFRGHFPMPFSLRNKEDEQRLYEMRASNEKHLELAKKENIRKISQDKRDRYAHYIDEIANEFEVPTALVHAVISVESAYNANAKSHVGAQGLMQLMPATAKSLGVKNAFDPEENIRGGVSYLKFLLERFGDISLALAGYNAGPGAVAKYGNKIPPYKETQAYVPRVLAYYYHYSNQTK